MAEPVFVALLFADRVITEAENSKRTIVGTFTTFYSPRVPVIYPPWFVYAAVTNIDPGEQHNYSISLVQDETEGVVLSSSGEFEVENRLVVPEIVVVAGNVRFPTFGTYTAVFNVDRRQVGSRKLEIQHRQSGGE